MQNLSEKETLAVRWWNMEKYKNYDAVICDGAIRSGKTYSMSIGFVAWAMTTFRDCSFAICGKTIKSVKRNVMNNLLSTLRGKGFTFFEKVSEGYVDFKMGRIKNRFYMFGGKDEASASLIQGMTLAGVFFDEVCLMPQSFVEQACARCSVKDSKIWFNCNPQNPAHWFYREWIKNTKKKNALYLHFTMADNPTLDEKIKKRYENLYTGVFYDRFILGKWTAAQGAIYPMFSTQKHVMKREEMPKVYDKYIVSADYGTVNPSSFGLWGRFNNKWYRIKEYYFDSKREGFQKTDEEHYKSLEALLGGIHPEFIICDPSAASFIETICRHGKYKVVPAKNDVLSGIRRVSDALLEQKILFCEDCRDIIREFTLYVWKDCASDSPEKENDHAMDDMRYFVNTYLIYEMQADEFYCRSLERA